MKRWAFGLAMAGFLALALGVGKVGTAAAATDIRSGPFINDQGVVVWTGSDGVQRGVWRWDPISQIPQLIHPNSNTFGDSEIQINAKGMAAWRGDDGSHDQIYFWDPNVKTVQPISQVNSNHDNVGPLINAQGVVVWFGFDGSQWQVWRWKPKSPTAAKISQNNGDLREYEVNAQGVVVWQDFDAAHHSQIWRWDPKSQPAKIISSSNSSHDNRGPRINAQGQVVWYAWDGSQLSLWSWPPKSSTAAKICNISKGLSEYYLNAKGQVVWMQGDNATFLYQLWGWDAKNPGTVYWISKDNLGYNSDPQINSQGVVLWRADVGTDTQIWRWDFKSKTVTKIAHPGYFIYSPLVNAKGQVVWIARDGSDQNSIWSWTPKSPTPQLVSMNDSSKDKMWLQINAKGEVVWVSLNGGSCSIWRYDPKTRNDSQIWP
jgi:hypothetical protein